MSLSDIGAPLGALFLTDFRARVRALKQLGDGALSQLERTDWHVVDGEGSNSAAVIVQHLSGNMRSRWSGFPDADGESGSRDRDREFLDAALSPPELLALWESGWAVFLGALDRLEAADMTRTVTIRGEPHTVLAAMQRQLSHYSGHVYQLIFIARLRRGAGWQTLSIAPGGSAAFNRAMLAQHTGPMTDSANAADTVSADTVSWLDAEIRIGLDALPGFHRAFLTWRGVEDAAAMPLRRVSQRVEAELNKMVQAGQARREGDDVLIQRPALDGFAAWPEQGQAG